MICIVKRKLSPLIMKKFVDFPRTKNPKKTVVDGLLTLTWQKVKEEEDDA